MAIDFESMTSQHKNQTAITFDNDIESKLALFGISVKISQSLTFLQVESSDLNLSDAVVEIALKIYTKEEPNWFIQTIANIYFTQPDCIAIQQTFATM